MSNTKRKDSKNQTVNSQKNTQWSIKTEATYYRLYPEKGKDLTRKEFDAIFDYALKTVSIDLDEVNEDDFITLLFDIVRKMTEAFEDLKERGFDAPSGFDIPLGGGKTIQFEMSPLGGGKTIQCVMSLKRDC